MQKQESFKLQKVEHLKWKKFMDEDEEDRWTETVDEQSLWKVFSPLLEI